MPVRYIDVIEAHTGKPVKKPAQHDLDWIVGTGSVAMAIVVIFIVLHYR